jgi:hypothetical protein
MKFWSFKSPCNYILVKAFVMKISNLCFFSFIYQILSPIRYIFKKWYWKFHVYGKCKWSKQYLCFHFKNPLLHNGCTFIMHKLYKCFFIEVESFKLSPNLAYKWFQGMLMTMFIHYPYQKLQWEKGYLIDLV